jgi:hypothetical protein
MKSTCLLEAPLVALELLDPLVDVSEQDLVLGEALFAVHISALSPRRRGVET